MWLAARELERRGDERGLTNVVFMGMGEPLLNFDASVVVARLLMDDLAYGISKRRVTISTAGVVPNIRLLAEQTDCALAVSLHAAEDALRDRLVPLNRRYPLAELMDACRSYLDRVGERRSVTFEYALMKGVNDSLSPRGRIGRAVAATALQDQPDSVQSVSARRLRTARREHDHGVPDLPAERRLHRHAARHPG